MDSVQDMRSLIEEIVLLSLNKADDAGEVKAKLKKKLEEFQQEKKKLESLLEERNKLDMKCNELLDEAFACLEKIKIEEELEAEFEEEPEAEFEEATNVPSTMKKD